MCNCVEIVKKKIVNENMTLCDNISISKTMKPKEKGKSCMHRFLKTLVVALGGT